LIRADALVRGAALFFHHAQEGTPAVKAGLKAGDVITAVNAEPAANARELTPKMGRLSSSSYATSKGIKEGDVILEVGGKKAVLLRVKSKEGTRSVAISEPGRAG
jgi:S1-C subfamily serine protease